MIHEQFTTLICKHWRIPRCLHNTSRLFISILILVISHFIFAIMVCIYRDSIYILATRHHIYVGTAKKVHAKQDCETHFKSQLQLDTQITMLNICKLQLYWLESYIKNFTLTTELVPWSRLAWALYDMW